MKAPCRANFVFTAAQMNNQMHFTYKIYVVYHNKQEPWRLPSRQAEFNGTDRLGLDARSDYQAVASNKGNFELKPN